MIALARRFGAKMVTSSYNEPLITAEWAVDIFKLARDAGLRTAFVSNGNATREVLEYLRPWTDCYKIDLKSMSDRNYRSLGGVLNHVLRTIEMVHDMGILDGDRHPRRAPDGTTPTPSCGRRPSSSPASLGTSRGT